jgi:hypothetical protein
MMVIWRVLEQSCRKRTSSGKGVISCCGDANQQQRVFEELTGVLKGTEDCARVLSMEKWLHRGQAETDSCRHEKIIKGSRLRKTIKKEKKRKKKALTQDPSF